MKTKQDDFCYLFWANIAFFKQQTDLNLKEFILHQK